MIIIIVIYYIISACEVWGKGQDSKREFHPHIHLDGSGLDLVSSNTGPVEIMSCVYF